MWLIRFQKFSEKILQFWWPSREQIFFKKYNLFYFFFKDFIYFQKERSGWRKREGDTSMCNCLLHTPLGTWPATRHVPWLGMEPVTFWFTLALNPVSHTCQGDFILNSINSKPVILTHMLEICYLELHCTRSKIITSKNHLLSMVFIIVS